MKRRSLLKLSVSIVSLAAAPLHLAQNAAGQSVQSTNSGANTAVFIPGYWPGDANYKGVAALDHSHLMRAIPKKYTGTIRMLTRLGLNGEVVQALFPVHGHDVEISPNGKIGFFGSLEHQSYVCFDPLTLDLITIGKPWKNEWIGGGHGIFLVNSPLLAVSERAPKTGYMGKPSRHFGRISLRDPETLKIIESHSSYGVSPHDIRMLADGKHLAIANYGSTYPRGKKKYGVPRHIVEPSISVIDINSGKLVAKYVSGSQEMELRHLCAHDFDTIFAIQTELGLRGQDQPFHKSDKMAYESELTVPERYSYLPAPLLQANSNSGKLNSLGNKTLQNLMRHGLSIHYEPVHKEVIATYPGSHSIMVFDGKSGELKQQIDCTVNGLDYPCGLTLLPDQRFYAVAGYWKNLYIFERGSHKLMRELCHYTTFFGHSHITTN